MKNKNECQKENIEIGKMLDGYPKKRMLECKRRKKKKILFLQDLSYKSSLQQIVDEFCDFCECVGGNENE